MKKTIIALMLISFIFSTTSCKSCKCKKVRGIVYKEQPVKYNKVKA